MTSYTVTIPGDAKGKGRPRVTFRGGRARAYTPQSTVNAEAWIKHCCIQQVGSPCLEGPLEMNLHVVFAIPPSWSDKKRGAVLAGDFYPTCKPDFDNLAKTCGDSLNGILWRDDAQIVDHTFSKRYGEAPMMTLTVTSK